MLNSDDAKLGVASNLRHKPQAGNLLPVTSGVMFIAGNFFLASILYKIQCVRIFLSGGDMVDLTGDHLIFSIIKEKHHQGLASLVEVGAWIWTESASSKVTDIDHVYEIPISPQTTLSTMIVNNITVSTLTKYDDPISTEYIRLLHEV